MLLSKGGGDLLVLKGLLLFLQRLLATKRGKNQSCTQTKEEKSIRAVQSKGEESIGVVHREEVVLGFVIIKLGIP